MTSQNLVLDLCALLLDKKVSKEPERLVFDAGPPHGVGDYVGDVSGGKPHGKVRGRNVLLLPSPLPRTTRILRYSTLAAERRSVAAIVFRRSSCPVIRYTSTSLVFPRKWGGRPLQQGQHRPAPFTAYRLSFGGCVEMISEHRLPRQHRFPERSNARDSIKRGVISVSSRAAVGIALINQSDARDSAIGPIEGRRTMNNVISKGPRFRTSRNAQHQPSWITNLRLEFRVQVLLEVEPWKTRAGHGARALANLLDTYHSTVQIGRKYVLCD